MLASRKLGLAGAAVLLLFAACSTAQPATSTTTSAPRATPLATAAPKAGPTAAPTASPQTAPAATPRPQGIPKPGGTLRYPLRTDPPVWDVQATTGGYQDARIQYDLVHEFLFNREPQTDKACQRDITPELAQSWKWIDDLTFELKIYPGVKFHNKSPINGREMTAEDVVFSLNRAFYVMQIRASKGSSDPIDKLVAVDPYTIRFINKGPNPGLVEAGLANFYGGHVLPRDLAKAEDKWEDPYKYWIGTGPFMFKEWRPGIKSIHVKNPDYWRKGLPYLDAIEFLVMPDHSTREAAVRTGQLDLWNWELEPMSAETLRVTAPKVILQECPPPVGFGGIYLRQDKPPFNDVRVRRAFSMAMDRDGILNSILGGHGYIGGTWPPAHPWYMKRDDFPPEVKKYLEYRPDEAKKLLAEAGYSQGLTVTLSTTPRWGIMYTAGVESVVASAAKAGFNVKPKFVEYTQFMASTIARKWPEDEQAALANIGRDSPWRDVLTFHTKGQPADNKGYASDPEYDKLAEEFMVTVDEAKQRELIRRIQIMSVDKAFWVLPPRAAAFSAHQPWVKGYNFSGDGYWSSAVFGGIWLDK